MSSEKKEVKLDISSSALEKSLEVAKSFADKLVLPSVEELGLLARDQISLWRFKNQVQILNKAKSICEKNNISVKAIPPKLLCPYLENASLEDDNDLQDKWAALLVNMADSSQNIQNQVFPYILSQLSKQEFNLLELNLNKKNNRVAVLMKELDALLRKKPDMLIEIETKKASLQLKLDDLTIKTGKGFSQEKFSISSSIRALDREAKTIDYEEAQFRRDMSAPQTISEENIKEFEMANIIRLGLAKIVYEATASTQSLDIPRNEDDYRTTIDFDINIQTETTTILTELGELFIGACQEKKDQAHKN